jgi:hypothetical protein
MVEEPTLFTKLNSKSSTADGVLLRTKGVLASLVVSIPTGYALFFVLSHTVELNGEIWVAFVPAPWSILIGILGFVYSSGFIRFIQMFWKVIILFQILGFSS